MSVKRDADCKPNEKRRRVNESTQRTSWADIPLLALIFGALIVICIGILVFSLVHAFF
jgi:hypothetical protein